MTVFRRCRALATAGAGAGSPAHKYSAFRHGAPSGVATWAVTLFSTSSATSGSEEGLAVGLCPQGAVTRARLYGRTHKDGGALLCRVACLRCAGPEAVALCLGGVSEGGDEGVRPAGFGDGVHVGETRGDIAQ
eukprot:scaffold73520_cov35-Phaeocystis_antarctica.AAC.1